MARKLPSGWQQGRPPFLGSTPGKTSQPGAGTVKPAPSTTGSGVSEKITFDGPYERPVTPKPGSHPKNGPPPGGEYGMKGS